jgi:hypothetical protein
MPWEETAPGVLGLPSGRLVRGRALKGPPPEGPGPDFAVYLLASEPPALAWETVWVRWPDFGLPADAAQAREAFAAAWRRCATQRVEVGCAGGRGRTGTALACLAILDGVPAPGAVAYVRANYYPGAVETPAQQRFVLGFAAPEGG